MDGSSVFYFTHVNPVKCSLFKKQLYAPRLTGVLGGGERNGQLNFLSPYFFPYFSPSSPIFFGRFSFLPDFSSFSLISLLRGLFYVLLHCAVPRLHMSVREKKENIRNTFAMSLHVILPILPFGFFT